MSKTVSFKALITTVTLAVATSTGIAATAGYYTGTHDGYDKGYNAGTATADRKAAELVMGEIQALRDVGICRFAALSIERYNCTKADMERTEPASLTKE